MTRASERRTNRLGAMRRQARSNAAGAIFSQMWQALGSFALQVVAARLLGASGLGSLSLCLGVMIMCTAVTSGMVGDSLTVLDRSDRRIRASLQIWSLLLALCGSLACAVCLVVSGVLDVPTGIAFFAATSLFAIDEVFRRLLMAVMRFWSLVLVDSAALASSLIALWALSRAQPPSLRTFLVAVLVGQVAGVIAAIAAMPSGERYLVAARRPALGAVARFGAWRGAQVAVTPTALTTARSVVVAAAGTAALGALEAARMVVAPAILAVQGLGSYLLSSYARDNALPLSVSMRRASRASVGMSLGVVVIGGLVAAATPLLGPLVSGGTFSVAPLAVFGWSVYAAAFAWLQPFASLAAARKRQRSVFALRVIDSMVGLAVLWLVLVPLSLPTAVAPFGLAVGPFLGGIGIRALILRPLARADSIGEKRASSAAPGRPAVVPTSDQAIAS